MRVKFMVLLMMVIMSIGSPAALAFSYPTYLNGDPNFIICGGHMGYACYVKKDSVVVQNYAPPNFEIYVETVQANFNDDKGRLTESWSDYKLGKLTPRLFRYNADSMRMIEYWSSDGKWHYIKPVGSMAETGHYYPGEMAYYIAFHQKFYGSRKFIDPFTGKYTIPNCAVGGGFYDEVDNSYSVQ